MSIEQIYNYERLTDGIGTSGQPTPDQFQAIAAAGFKTVINLAMPDSDNALPNEGNLVSSQGMTYVHLPVDFANPTMTDLAQFCGLMQTAEPATVWVHCVVNARVSAFTYLYLRYVKGLPEEACRTALLDKWSPGMDDVWTQFLLDGAAHLQAQSEEQE